MDELVVRPCAAARNQALALGFDIRTRIARVHPQELDSGFADAFLLHFVQTRHERSPQTPASPCPAPSGAEFTTASTLLSRSSKAFVSIARTYTSTTLANCAACEGVTSPATTPATIAAAAATLSAGFSRNGSSMSTGSSFSAGAS